MEIDSNTVIVGDFNIPLVSVDRSSGEKFKETAEPDGFHRPIQNITFKCSRIHILLKCTWNFLKDRPLATEQISINLKRLKSYQASFPITVV